MFVLRDQAKSASLRAIESGCGGGDALEHLRGVEFFEEGFRPLYDTGVSLVHIPLGMSDKGIFHSSFAYLRAILVGV